MSVLTLKLLSSYPLPLPGAAARKEEIISACRKLYAVRSFKEITIKEIGEATSFTRTSIYNYFQTKEEIFLALLQQECEQWNQSLRQLRKDHPRLTRLAEFKAAYGQSLAEVRSCLDQYAPGMTAQEKQDFIYSFFPFLFGIYPYTFVTEKQKAAMDQAGVGYVYLSIYEITFGEVKRLLTAG